MPDGATLIIDTPPLEVVSVVVTSLIGMFGVAVAMQNYYDTHLSLLERIIALVGGLTLIIPGIVTDTIGITLILLLSLSQHFRKKHELKYGDIIPNPKSIFKK